MTGPDIKKLNRGLDRPAYVRGRRLAAYFMYFCAAFACISGSFEARAQSIEIPKKIQEKSMAHSENAQRDGERLRGDIEDKFSKLKKTGQLNSLPDGNDIADLVQSILPLGITFDNAEKILKAAGFKIIMPRATVTSYVVPGPNDVSAELPLHRSMFPGDYSSRAAIILRPKDSRKFDIVAARIYTDNL